MSDPAVTELDVLIGSKWKKPPFVKRAWLRWALTVGAVIYLVLAIASVEVNWSRVYEGLDRGADFVT